MIHLPSIAYQQELTHFYHSLFRELTENKGDSIVQLRGTEEAVDVLLSNASPELKQELKQDILAFAQSFVEQTGMNLSVI